MDPLREGSDFYKLIFLRVILSSAFKASFVAMPLLQVLLTATSFSRGFRCVVALSNFTNGRECLS